MSERHSGPSPLTGVVLADCAACPHRALLAEGRCEPGDVCLMAHSGRQIDRFLRRNPGFAGDCLRDFFWERRAIAARYAPLEALRRLPRDRDEVVRRVVASRLPVDELDAWLHDEDREVRMTVANRLAPERLNELVGDQDYLVRLTVAKRLPHGQLSRMAHDPEREVRKEVARRLPPFALGLMARDEDAEVRRIAAERIVQTVQSANRNLRDTALNLSHAAAEYWTEEHPLLAKPRDIAAFVQQVDRLRDDIARLEHRIRNLSNR